MYNENKNNHTLISIGKKLYEEKDYPLESKIISEDKINGLIQRESTWRGQIKGFNLFPDGSLQGSGISYVHSNGVSISHWQGTFIPVIDLLIILQQIYFSRDVIQIQIIDLL